MMANALKAEGIKACMAQDYPTAAIKFTQAINLDPDNHLLYTKRSAVYTAQSEYQNALVDANKAVEIKPQCVKGWLFKGAALHGLKDLVAARDVYEEALRIDPNSQHAQYGKKVVQEAIDGKALKEVVDVENAEKSVKSEGLSKTEESGAEAENSSTDMDMKNSSAIPVSFASIGTPKFIFGHEVEFPKGPADLLEAWHLVYPSCIPPCSYTISGLPRQQWKVFDRNGNELKYTLFQINSETAPLYRVLVLHDLAGADRLMSCADMGRKKTWKRTFLLAWNGIEKEFDSEVSAVRLIGKTHDGIGFHKNIFRAAPKNPRLRNSTIKRSSMSLTAPGQTRSLRTSRKKHTIKAPPKETPASEVGSSETSSESDVSEYQKLSLPKKLRISSAPSGPIQTHKIEDVVFKLISEQTDDTRCFPMVECSSGKMLFAKSRKFFRLINPDAKVDILSCRLPFQHERRYLFEGSEGEFSLLLADIQNSKGSQKSPIIVVKCIT